MLWLLSFDDKNTLADAVDKYCIGVPPIQWLAWIPQLLTCLVGSEGKPLLNLISQVRPLQSVLKKSYRTRPQFVLKPTSSFSLLSTFYQWKHLSNSFVKLSYHLRYVWDHLFILLLHFLLVIFSFINACLLCSSIIHIFSLPLWSIWGSTSGRYIRFSVHALHLSNQDKLTAFTPKWPLSCFLFTKLSIQILSLSLLRQFIGFHWSLVNWFLNYLFKKLF